MPHVIPSASGYSRSIPRIILLILSIFIASSAGAQLFERSSPDEEGMSSVQLQRLSQLASKYVAEGRVPGIVNLVMRNGKIVHLEAVGNRGVDDETPMQLDDLFRIYSMTKPITSVAAMQLYEEGKFQLSDPVTKFVPELHGLNVLNDDGTLSPVEREMTMHQLLMHTAGFSYGFHPYRDPVDRLYVAADLTNAPDLEGFVSKLAELPPKISAR